MFYTVMDSPVGKLTLAGTRELLAMVRFEHGGGRGGPEPGWERYDEPFRAARRELTEYFAGRRQHFELAIEPRATAFQRAVLDALRAIPYGETRSYKEVAQAIGKPAAVRAVGAANGSNPIPIIIPCHRVIGSNGALTGFGGGLDAKRYLLDLERRNSGLFSD
jgi:methylated-DNA-[protein]-cysteine S-methyltransferase